MAGTGSFWNELLKVFDDANDVPMAVKGTDGAVHVTDTYSGQSVVDNVGGYLYTGFAPYGTATSAAGWRMYRQVVTATGLGAKLRADGDELFNNVWDDRLTETYS